MSCLALALLAQIPEIQPQEGDIMCESNEGNGAIGTVLIENEWVRVTRWYFP